MLFGPIFRWEIVAAGRRGRYFILRVLYALILLLVLWVTYSSSTAYSRFGAGQDGVSISQMAFAAAAFFNSFSWVQLLGIIAVAPAMAVGAIASERERRTIEYLFATDRSNAEIVFGKTLARLLLVLKFVLVSMPLLFLFRLLGGIPADLVTSSALIAGSTALVVTTLSVCVSVWAPKSRDAATRVYRILAALLIVPPIATTFVEIAGRGSGWQTWLRPLLGFLNGLNPLVVLGSSMSGFYAMGAGFNFEPIVRMGAWHLGLSLVLVAISTAAVRRVQLREGSKSPATAKRRPGRLMPLPRWRPQVSDNAMLWKEAFAPTSRTKLGWAAGAANVVVVVAALAGVLYSFATALTGLDRWSREGYFIFAAFFTGTIGVGLLLLLAARGAGLVTIEKERDCWVSLLSTPLTGREIMTGKLLGNLYAMRWGLLLLAVAWVCGIILDVRYLFVSAAMAAAFVLCAWFVTDVALAYSLRSNTTLRALGFSLATTLFIGGGYLMCCCPILAIGRVDDDSMAVGLAPCMPFLFTAPSVAFAEGDLTGSGPPIIAWGIGVVGYLIASLMLLAYMSSNFDALVGRTVVESERRSAPADA
jgi:ABC-type transport system involved in multi-copper enzyme maturation permease subunit